MENVTLRAHFDGRAIVLDEPYELEEGAELLVTVLAGQSTPSNRPAGPDQPQPAGERVVFNRVAIRDPEVNNIEGATLLLPEGWNLEGGFVWTPLYSVQASLLVRASDPRTGAAVETLPTQYYVWPLQMAVPMQIGTNYLGSVLMPPPANPVELVQNIFMQGPLQHLRGARLDGVEDMPQLAAELARSQGTGRTVYVSRLRYSYQFSGHAWEEDVYPTVIFEPADGMIVMWYGMGTTMRAPAGELERLRPLLSVIVPSIRYTLDWSACLEHVKQMYRQNRANQQQRTRELGQMLTQYREEMRRAHQQVYEERMASQDRISFARREVIGGVETYVDPFGSRAVELPSGYSYNWVSRSGAGHLHQRAGIRPARRRHAQLGEHAALQAVTGQLPVVRCRLSVVSCRLSALLAWTALGKPGARGERRKVTSNQQRRARA